jgi:hypothetical protein
MIRTNNIAGKRSFGQNKREATRLTRIFTNFLNLFVLIRVQQSGKIKLERGHPGPPALSGRKTRGQRCPRSNFLSFNLITY